jgi:hypothetical protein
MREAQRVPVTSYPETLWPHPVAHLIDHERRKAILTEPGSLETFYGRDKGRRLLFHQMLLERLQDGLCFGQRETQMLDLLVPLLQHRDFLHRLFTTILCTHDELHLDLHRVSSRLGHTD